MSKTLKLKILNTIGKVYNASEKSKLEKSLFKSIDNELSILADYFHTSKSEAFFISIIFSINFNGRTAEFENLNSHFDSNPMKLLEFSDDLIQLHEKNFLVKIKNFESRCRGKFNLKGVDQSFCINDVVSEKIFNGEEFPTELLNILTFDDIFILLEKVYTIGKERDEEKITTRELFKQIQQILDTNENIPLVKQVKSFGMRIDEKYLFLYTAWKYLEGYKEIYVSTVFKGIYDQNRERFIEMQRFLEGKTTLIKDNWLELDDAVFFDDTKFSLSDKSLELLTDCDLKLFKKRLDKKKRWKYYLCK
ncbi:MAG: hypothetical protein LAT51_09415 [Flavobacteriaceae bacterium]|nr:hypothetical protein [Flavobacteriaceae bacterium]